jgi:hypothetical protein
MKIDCYISEGCGSKISLKENVEEAVRLEAAAADVRFHTIDETEAKRLGLMGSPSVLINGEDILPGEIPGIS